jgi:hypothetical protein
MAILSLLGFALAAGVIALVVAALVTPGPWLARMVEVTCWAVIVIAAITGAISIGQSLIGDTTTVQVPIAVHTPEVRVPGVVIEKPAAVIVSGGVDRATLTIRGLSWEPRILLALETLLQSGAVVYLAWVIRRLAHNIREGAPFAGLSRPLVRAAGVLFLGGFLWSIAGGTGAYLAGREALEIHAGYWPDSVLGGPRVDMATALSYLGWPEPGTWSVNFSMLPFAVALVLALLGLVFRMGERLQADTDGLI